MPIGYPGNSISKEARAKAGGGFESAIEVAVEPTGAPTIDSAVDNGDGTLTISGSNFGSKAQAAPYTFERFEGTDGQLVDAYNPDWIAYGGRVGAILSSAQSHSGTVSASNTLPSRNQFDTNYFIYPESNVVRVAYWVYYDTVEGDSYQSGSTTQIKNTRITSTAAAGGGGEYNGTGDFAFGGFFLTEGSGQITRNNGVTVLGSTEFSSENNEISNSSNYFGMSRRIWNRVDMMIKLSDPGVANGEVRVHRISSNNNQNAIWKNRVTLGAGQSFKQDATILGTMIVNYSSAFGNPLSVYIDDVYVDGTWAAVEIGDNPDYYACTRRDLLPPSAWSGTSLTVDKNFGPVPAGTNYLFVMNEAGEVNATGYEVTI